MTASLSHNKTGVAGRDIGVLLALLHDSQIVSFEGEFRHWIHTSPSTGVVVDGDGANSTRVAWRGGGLFPRPIETVWRIWFEQPDRARVELGQGNQLIRLGVRDGDSWWRWDRVHGIDTGAAVGAGGVPTLPPLLDPPLLSPAGLIARFRLEPAGNRQRLGRDVLIARARLRNAPPGEIERSFEFEFDAVHGTMLRRATFENERCVQVIEALVARFDMTIDAERFVFGAPRQAPGSSIAAG